MKTKIVKPLTDLLLDWQKYGHHTEWKPVTAIFTADGEVPFQKPQDLLLVISPNGALRHFKRRELSGAIPIGSTGTAA